VITGFFIYGFDKLYIFISSYVREFNVFTRCIRDGLPGVLAALGRKLNIPGKRTAGAVMNKSQTLPRSMGRSHSYVVSPRPNKPTSTPPAIKRQLSVRMN
jgi:hypothetical protein